MTIKEAAEAIGVTPQTIRNHMTKGTLRVERLRQHGRIAIKVAPDDLRKLASEYGYTIKEAINA